ncbi:MAG TPA: energy transducer TonB [Blastocatellia bacterium]|nr:energy transducer TonB [Blastocatellia bacterium]
MERARLFETLESESLGVRLLRALRESWRDFREDPRGFLQALFGAESEPLWKRFGYGFRDHWREFRADPRNYLRFLLSSEEPDHRRKRVLLVSCLLYVTSVVAIVSLERFASRPIPSPLEPSTIAKSPITFVEPLTSPRLYAPRQKERAGGGGGGGRREPRPPSFGRLPKAELKPPIVAPSPHLPEIKQPSLPVLPTIMAQPELLPKLDLSLPLGDPTSRSSVPSSGPGSGGGIGTGQGGGVGPGRGVGYGPGEGWNTGGGEPRIGGGDIASRPIITFKPRPEWTEEARRNRIQGVVVLSATFAADGRIKNVRIVRGLGYGLDEKAIEAALRIRFIPARDARGNPVDWRGTIHVEFNLL